MLPTRISIAPIPFVAVLFMNLQLVIVFNELAPNADMAPSYIFLLLYEPLVAILSLNSVLVTANVT